MRGIVLVAALVVLAVPPALGQGAAVPLLTWEVADSTGQVTPTEVTQFEALLHVACGEGSVASPSSWTIQVGAVAVDDVSGFGVSWTPAAFEVDVDPVACATGETLASETILVNLTAAGTIPAGTLVAVALTATEASHDDVATASTMAPIGPWLSLQARLVSTIHKVAPGEMVSLRLVATNFGNADLVLTAGAGEGTSRFLTATWPDEMLVPAGEERTFVIEVETGGAKGVYENRRDQFNVDVSGAWTSDPSVAVMARPLQAVIQQQGSPIGEAPAPSPALLVGLIGLAFVAVRRLRG